MGGRCLGGSPRPPEPTRAHTMRRRPLPPPDGAKVVPAPPASARPPRPQRTPPPAARGGTGGGTGGGQACGSQPRCGGCVGLGPIAWAGGAHACGGSLSPPCVWLEGTKGQGVGGGQRGCWGGYGDAVRLSHWGAPGAAVGLGIYPTVGLGGPTGILPPPSEAPWCSHAVGLPHTSLSPPFPTPPSEGAHHCGVFWGAAVGMGVWAPHCWGGGYGAGWELWGRLTDVGYGALG